MTTQNGLVGNSKAESRYPLALERLIQGLAKVVAQQVLDQAKERKKK